MGDVAKKSIQNKEEILYLLENQNLPISTNLYSAHSKCSVDFNLWFSNQPEVWLCINKNKKAQAEKWLKSNLVEIINQDEALCWSVASDANLDEFLQSGLGWVMDWASQKAIETAFSHAQFSYNSSIWDACCGAGGKSLYLANNGFNEMYASDKRADILQNLKDRFIANGFILPAVKNIDLIKLKSQELGQYFNQNSFDCVVCDAPCSGSGTWRRNPENYSFFEIEVATSFALVQQSIVKKLWPFVKPKGKLIYITCSAFSIENENNAEFFSLHLEDAELLQAEYIINPTGNSDIMYYCILEKTD